MDSETKVKRTLNPLNLTPYLNSGGVAILQSVRIAWGTYKGAIAYE